MAKIPFGIVITTSEFTKDFLPQCLNSIKDTQYPILVVGNNYIPDSDYPIVINRWNAFELGGILQGKKHFTEFVHLMDTTIVKDITLFDKLLEIEGNVFLTHGGYHYMGKFVSDLLPEIPKISTKEEAIQLELHWLKKPYTFFEPDLPVHTDVFEEIHGSKRMKLENDFIIKYKGTYHI